jgi:hypothetical protein
VKELQDNGVECSKIGEQMNIHDEEQSGRPSAVSDDLVQSVDQKIYERWGFTISEILCEF